MCIVFTVTNSKLEAEILLPGSYVRFSSMWQPDIAINIGTQSHIISTGMSTNIIVTRFLVHEREGVG